MKIRSKPYPKTVKSGWNIHNYKNHIASHALPPETRTKVAVAQEDKRITAKSKKRNCFFIILSIWRQRYRINCFIFAQP